MFYRGTTVCLKAFGVGHFNLRYQCSRRRTYQVYLLWSCARSRASEGEDIKMYYPWQQLGKRGFSDALRRVWRPADLNVGGGTWGRFEAGFLINITFKTSHATINCSSYLFRPVRRFEIILPKFPSTNVHSLYHKFTYLLPAELCAAVSSFLTPIEDHLPELFGVVRRSLEASGEAHQRFLLSNFIQNFEMILF